MKVALYARVSSEKQAEKELSIPAQLKALREYATKNGYIVVREFVDEAETARTSNRPAFKEMISLSRLNPPPFEAILTWKFSRFARNREDSIIYKSLLRKKGIQVISINEPIDNTPSGKLLEGIIEVIDEFYSENLAQDVVRGMSESVSRGFFCGGVIPLGYQRVVVNDGQVKRSKLELDEARALVVKRMFSECLEGKGTREIGRSLNKAGIVTRKGKKWNPTSVYQILTNEVYTGTLVWGKKRKKKGLPLRVKHAFPEIVDIETFKKVRSILAQRGPRFVRPRSVSSNYLLGGMMKCAECGAGMVGGAYKSGQFAYYRCGKALRQGPKACPGHWLPRATIEGFVIDKIKTYILTDENLRELVELTNEEILNLSESSEEKVKALEAQIKDIDSRLERLYDALETGKLDLGELASRISDLISRKKDLQEAIAEVLESGYEKPINAADVDEIKHYVDDLRAVLGSASILEQKAFLRSFVKRIDVSKSEVTINYTLPMPPLNENMETVGVLGFKQNGGRCWT